MFDRHSKMKKVKAFIFDYDGVLAESNQIKTEAFRQIFKREATNNVDKFLAYHKKNEGISRIDKIKFFYESILKNKLEEKDLELKALEFSNLVLDKVIKCKKVKGSNKFIKNNFNNFNLFVSTGTPQEEISLILKKTKINNFFKMVLGSPKTKKQHISFIMKKYNLSSDEIIFIGDSKTDMLAAESFKIHFILRTHNLNKELSESFRGDKINDFNDLNNLLKIN